MKIPERDGVMMLSASQARVYGAGGHQFDGQEETQGCPRRYQAKYVTKDLPEEEPSYALTYGSLWHRVMELMEGEGLDPESAMQQAITSEHTIEMVDELRADLEKYLARPASPLDMLATIGTERRLIALLYVDEEFGPVYYQGILDRLAIDPEDLRTVHGIDYKTNRGVPGLDDMIGDIQMRGYHWLIRECAEEIGALTPTRVVIHKDLAKYRDYQTVYTDAQIEAWHTLMVAIARTILRDEEAEPITNSGCPTCPIRFDCPAFSDLPKSAGRFLGLLQAGGDLVEQKKWRDEANSVKNALAKAVKNFDERLNKAVMEQGEIVVGSERYVKGQAWKTVIDVQRIAEILGEDFPAVASVSKAAVERSNLPDVVKQEVLNCWSNQPDGFGVSKERADG